MTSISTRRTGHLLNEFGNLPTVIDRTGLNGRGVKDRLADVFQGVIDGVDHRVDAGGLAVASQNDALA